MARVQDVLDRTTLQQVQEQTVGADVKVKDKGNRRLLFLGIAAVLAGAAVAGSVSALE